MDDGFPQGKRLDGGIENLTKRQFPHSKLFHGNSTRPWNAEKPPAEGPQTDHRGVPRSRDAPPNLTARPFTPVCCSEWFQP